MISLNKIEKLTILEKNGARRRASSLKALIKTEMYFNIGSLAWFIVTVTVSGAIQLPPGAKTTTSE